MLHPHAFDTHAYVKKLKAVGFTEEQAEVQTEVIAVLIDEQLTTKQDLKELEIRLKHDLTLRLGTMLAASMAIIATIIKLIS